MEEIVKVEDFINKLIFDITNAISFSAIFNSSFFYGCCEIFLFSIFLVCISGYLRNIEHHLRVLLIFIILVILPLIIPLCWYMRYGSVFKFYSKIFYGLWYRWTSGSLRNMGEVIQLIIGYIFLHCGVFLIPFSTIYYFLFGYKSFLKSMPHYDTVEAKRNDSDNIFIYDNILNTFNKAVSTTNIKRFPALFYFNNNNLFTKWPDCFIIGKNNRSAAIFISNNIVNAVKNKKIDSEDIKVIFLHELNHMLNNDLNLLLWGKTFLNSKIILLAYSFITLFIFFSLFPFMWINTNRFYDSFRKIYDAIIGALLILPFIILIKWAFQKNINSIIREREYIVDARVAFNFLTPHKVIETLNKINNICKISSLKHSLAFFQKAKNNELYKRIKNIKEKAYHNLRKQKEYLPISLTIYYTLIILLTFKILARIKAFQSIFDHSGISLLLASLIAIIHSIPFINAYNNLNIARLRESFSLVTKFWVGPLYLEQEEDKKSEIIRVGHFYGNILCSAVIFLLLGAKSFAGFQIGFIIGVLVLFTMESFILITLAFIKIIVFLFKKNQKIREYFFCF